MPHCIALRLDDDPDAEWTAIVDLTAGDGRIIAPWLAQAVVKRGMKDERWEVIEILYGTAALDWIHSARAAGWLAGMTSNVGRPADA